MTSRAVFLAACFAAAAGESYNLQCTPASATCGGKCCAVMWTLGGTDGSFTCSKAGTGEKCGLCGQDGIKKCDFTVENSGVPVAKLLDPKNDPVEHTVPVVGGAGFGVAPTRPSSGVMLTLGTYNGMNGWFDIPLSTFNGFADFLLGLTATVPSFYTDSGYTVQYSCRRSGVVGAPADFAGCDIFFFVYKCPPCESLDGGVPAQLMGSADPEWYAGSCGPTFNLNHKLDTVDHQLAVWQAEVEDGTTVNIKLAGPVEFMFWAMVGKSVVCSAKLTEAACNTASANCVWLADDGVCRPRGCPKPPPFSGPSLSRCSVCVRPDEEEFLPEVLFH
ncbi:hypothetical protein DIPPA_07379 [Diplonema papillatum]|nr:hypothetical protein DIPPA_28712 [Diplonema papillatum]KAJ9451782.1 hypothetical protein DIPPA_07379 [Diplonema papillatum]